MVDLAAGTGKSTALVVGTGADVVAVEPVAEMRAHFELPGVEPIAGTAEAIPLRDASVDVVCVFQAFHWFDEVPALADIARVLRPGGGLAIVWNVRDRRVAWVRQMAELMESVVGPLPYERHHNAMPGDEGGQDAHWAAVVAASGRFSPLRVERFDEIQPATVDLVIGRAASTSYVAKLPDPDRAYLLDGIRHLLIDHPDLVGRKHFDFPHRTSVYWCRRCR